MTRVASRPPRGPAASSSAFAPPALAPAAPSALAPAPALSPPGGAAAGFAGLLAQPTTPSARATNSTAISLLCILLLSPYALMVRMGPRPAHGSPLPEPSGAGR